MSLIETYAAQHRADRIGLRAPLAFAPVTLLGLGLAYCVAGALPGYLLFSHAANGSLIERDGRVVGSKLLAQAFIGWQWFHPRPSAANYDPMAATGSNQARSNPDLQARIAAAIAEVAAREGIAPGHVPGELVTQSGAGLDPHLTPRGALVQAARVARIRGLDVAQVEALIAEHTEGRQFGLLGEPRVNVLRLNLALEDLR